jgi:hypothetical protein
MVTNAKEKYEKQISELHWTEKARALGALEREKEKYEDEKFIYDYMNKYGYPVIEITKYENFHFVKYSDKGEKYYTVFINGKKCNKITQNKHMIMLIALEYEYEGINSDVAFYMGRMLGINEE